MTVGLKMANNTTPVTGSFDFNSAPQFDQPGPYWISFIAWVETADLLAGSLQLDLFNTDPTGVDSTIPIISFSPQLDLTNPASVVQSAVTLIQRQSGTSPLHFDTTLFGLAGSAKIAYRIMVFPLDPTELSTF